MCHTDGKGERGSNIRPKSTLRMGGGGPSILAVQQNKATTGHCGGEGSRASEALREMCWITGCTGRGKPAGSVWMRPKSRELTYSSTSPRSTSSCSQTVVPET